MASKGQPDTSGNGAVEKASPFKLLLRQMSEMATQDEAVERTSTSEADVMAIMATDNESEMWKSDDFDSWNAQKLSGADIEIEWFEIKRGPIDPEIKSPFIYDGSQLFLLVHSFRLTEEQAEGNNYNLPKVGLQFTWNTSAPRIVAKLMWMLREGWFDPQSPRGPVQCRIEGTKLSGGRSVEKLKPIKGGPITVKVVAEEPAF